MPKDFALWHKKKEEIEGFSRRFFAEGEVWWCYLGANLGTEQDGKGENFLRPVLIIRKLNQKGFWGVPLSTKSHDGTYFISIDIGDNLKRDALLHQLRFFDAKRLVQKMGKVKHAELVIARNRVADLLSFHLP